MPETGEDVTPDEVSGVDADESETRAVVIDRELIKEAHEESPRPEPKETDDGGA
jgi:hypothetical protein